MQHARPVLDDQGTAKDAYASERWLVLMIRACARYSPYLGGVHFSTKVSDPPAGTVSSLVSAPKSLFAAQSHTAFPVVESITTKSYFCMVGYTTFTGADDGFFTVNVSVTSPLTLADSVDGSWLLGRTFTGGCANESDGG